MASPWKFLSRLVSSRRGQKPDSDSIDDVTRDVPRVVETRAENSESSVDRTAGVEPPRDDPADPVSAAPAPPQGVGRDPHDRVDGESAERVVGSDAALPGDIVAAASIDHQAAKLEKAKGEQRGRKVRGQKAKTVAVALELASVVHNADDLRIDAEIKVLREQLASKLRLQNAQLKKMLERFER